MPPIGLLLGKVDFANLFISLDGKSYPTLAAAAEAGAPTLNYGNFITVAIQFFIIAWAIFLVVKAINVLKREDKAAANAPAAPTEEVKLLTEIRDSLRQRGS